MYAKLGYRITAVEALLWHKINLKKHKIGGNCRNPLENNNSVQNLPSDNNFLPRFVQGNILCLVVDLPFWVSTLIPKFQHQLGNAIKMYTARAITKFRYDLYIYKHKYPPDVCGCCGGGAVEPLEEHGS